MSRLQPLKSSLVAYVKRVGCELVADPERDKTMVQVPPIQLEPRGPVPRVCVGSCVRSRPSGVQELLDMKDKVDFIVEQATSTSGPCLACPRSF